MDMSVGCYVIHSSELRMVKIGHTSSLNRRMRAIETGCPTTLTLIAWIGFGEFPNGVYRYDDDYLASLRAARAQERDLHVEFKSLRVRGEWFRYVGALVERFPIVKVARG